MWLDIACIVFIAVTMNHLGLIGEIERITGKRLIVLNCPKCASFWLILAYGLVGMESFYGEFVQILAISFLCAYFAIWIELLEGFIDILYMWLYEKIYPNSQNDTPAADADNCDSASTVSNL